MLDIIINGRSAAAYSFWQILCACIARNKAGLQRQRWWTISRRTAGIMFYFGMKITGKAFVKIITTAQSRVKKSAAIQKKLVLMAGLLLADKTAAVEDKIREVEAELETLRAASGPAPERIEVPVVPDSVTDTLAELAARAESLAAEVEEKVNT